MSNIIDVSSKLGEYIGKGWTFTDATCPSPACHGVPLMRSPGDESPVTYYCPNCNGPQQCKETPNRLSWPNDAVCLTTANDSATQSNSSSTDSLSTHESHSRPSTPPTEISSTLSSPTFAPPVDTEETIRRRQQSDQASAEIGKRLLKGWAMLGDECPNIRCYGIPLVRPPKTGEDKDPCKECVICGTVYVTDVSEGWQRLVPAPIAVELTGAGNSMSSAPRASSSRDKGKAVVGSIPLQSSPLLPASESQLTVNFSKRERDLAKSSEPLHVRIPSMNAAAVRSPAQALKQSLDVISQRLGQICDDASHMDVASIASAADAINKVAQALLQVRQLEDH